MKNKKVNLLLKTLAAITLLPVTLFGGFVLYSRIRYKRSSGATVVERVIKKTLGYILETPAATEEYLKQRSLVEDERFTLPEIKYKSKVEDTSIEGCQTIVFNEEEENSRIILYIHGGGYVADMKKRHAAFCDHMAKKTNSTVVVPIYPLAPNHTYEETYDIIKKIYLHLQKTNKSILMSGDSAGGGFVIGFCQYLYEQHIQQPDKLILISPWVDISMSGTGYAEYEKVDPLMNVEGLIIMGKAWAGETDTKHYQLSPLFGDVDCLPEMLLFTGTREVFYPDIIKFYNKISDKSKVELVVGAGMDHVYPIYPILEARKAMKQIVDFIKK